MAARRVGEIAGRRGHNELETRRDGIDDGSPHGQCGRRESVALAWRAVDSKAGAARPHNVGDSAKASDMVKELLALAPMCCAFQCCEMRRQQSAAPREVAALGGLTPMMFAARENVPHASILAAQRQCDPDGSDGYTPLIFPS
jgi:hypothetical protein